MLTNAPVLLLEDDIGIHNIKDMYGKKINRSNP
jgi:hypothetical protein